MPTLLYIPRFDECGPGPRYRVYQYLDSLRKLGLNITVKPLLDIQYLNDLYFKNKRSIPYLIKIYLRRAIFLFFNKSKFDLVLMDGELFPFLPFFIERMFLPKRYIIDQDDAIFHTYDKHKSFLIRLLLGGKIGKIWKNSQHIIVGNAYVKKITLSLGAKQVTALPTVVDANKYKPSNTTTNALKEEIIIGWVGSPATASLLSLIHPALKNVAQKANIVLYIIGAEYNLDGVKTVCIDWKNGWSEEEEIKLTNSIDIGIMPLLDVPYQLGKCGFKLIKYMACAKPMIASAVGMNIEIIDHDQNGYLASTQEDWEKYLLLLVENAEKRKLFGQAGREKMLATYSLQATSPILCDIVMRAYSDQV